jgi:hypothetical protein
MENSELKREAQRIVIDMLLQDYEKQLSATKSVDAKKQLDCYVDELIEESIEFVRLYWGK